MRVATGLVPGLQKHCQGFWQGTRGLTGMDPRPQELLPADLCESYTSDDVPTWQGGGARAGCEPQVRRGKHLYFQSLREGDLSAPLTPYPL